MRMFPAVCAHIFSSARKLGIALNPRFRISKYLERYDIEEMFARKNVVLMGPSTTVTESLRATVAQADLLCVVNKGYRLDSFSELRRIAKRTTLFHCLDLSETTGGGALCTSALKKLGMREIIYPLNEARFQDNLLAFHRHNSALLPLYCIRSSVYSDLREQIGGYTPNTGFASIWMILASGCTHLHVTGMNFMRLPYSNSYHDHLHSLSDAIQLIEKHGNHNPDLDLIAFKQLYSMGRVSVDDELAAILKRPVERLFYRDKYAANQA